MKAIYALVLTVMITGFTSSAKAAPTSYPLVCRGGGTVTLGYDSASAAAMMYFAKAAGPAGQGLQPGQCSWVDRAIGTNEPPCIRQTGVVAQVWWFIKGTNQQSYANSTQAPWYRKMTEANQFQTFQVYNPGNGCFVVTRLGP